MTFQRNIRRVRNSGGIYRREPPIPATFSRELEEEDDDGRGGVGGVISERFTPRSVRSMAEERTKRVSDRSLVT